MSQLRTVLYACLVVGALTFTGGCANGEIAAPILGNDEAITMSQTPAPGNGNYGDHFDMYARSFGHNMSHAGNTLWWLLFNTNSEDVPYESFSRDQWPRAMYTISQTFDNHLFNYDWNDPFATSF